jgi:MoaA/NifB/PqqE/SkfB family radical SAM enzyme
MINQRLFDWYKIDTNKNLNIYKRCPRPFDTILIDKNGSCYACECTAWLPQSIGNLQIQPLENIIESDTHKHLQQSIIDKTYRYCNNKQCSYLLNALEDENRWPAEIPEVQIKHIRLAIDDSCNLKCPSCRTKLIFHKEGSQFKKGIRLADKINDWLSTYSKPVQVHIGSDGDPFASHVYRHFMEHTPKSSITQYSLLTNGLMFKDFHPRIPHIIENLTRLGVSIDGATKETYEKLRLGGKWDNINRNLECIAELKQQHNFKFELHMVVQKDNWQEIQTMIELGKQLGTDKIYFNKIQDWNTGQNINEVLPPDNEEYNSIRSYIQKLQVQEVNSDTFFLRLRNL